jgi:hypothetical protein
VSQPSTIDLKALRQSLRDPGHKGFQGKRFNRYDLLAEISRGGMGVVVRAKHTELGSLVALKLLAAQDPTPEATARFRREAKVLAQLKHPHVVGISDLGEDGGIPFLAMELIEGSDLQSIVQQARSKRGHLPLKQVVDVGLAMAQALAYCHEQGAIHRDIKPQNILVERSTGRSVLTDFGLVKRDPNKMSSSQSAAVSQAGKLLGTPSFMAPEQFEPDGEYGAVGPKSDVWGLGATIFYMLTGQPPYTATNVVNLYSAVLHEPVRPVSDVRDGIPAALEEVVAQCLTKHTDRRPSMAQVAERLVKIAADPALLVASKGGAGLRGALAVLGVFVILAGLDLAVLNPQHGDWVMAKLTGEAQPSGGDAGAPPPPPKPPADGSSTGAAEADVPGEDAAEEAELERLRRRAQDGEVDYMVALGSRLARRDKGSQAEAVRWFKTAAKAGNDKAQFWLGVASARGLGGVAQDEAVATRWFQRAAEAGNVRAMLWLGELHGREGDADPDPAEALAWFRRALTAAADDPEAKAQAEREIKALLKTHPELGR